MYSFLSIFLVFSIIIFFRPLSPPSYLLYSMSLKSSYSLLSYLPVCFLPITNFFYTSEILSTTRRIRSQFYCIYLYCATGVSNINILDINMYLFIYSNVVFPFNIIITYLMILFWYINLLMQVSSNNNNDNENWWFHLNNFNLLYII